MSGFMPEPFEDDPTLGDWITTSKLELDRLRALELSNQQSLHLSNAITRVLAAGGAVHFRRHQEVHFKTHQCASGITATIDFGAFSAHGNAVTIEAAFEQAALNAIQQHEARAADAVTMVALVKEVLCTQVNTHRVQQLCPSCRER